MRLTVQKFASSPFRRENKLLMENIITCGLSRAELDAHRVGISQLCPALKPDGTQCNCPYSAHLSAPPPGNYLHPVNFIVLFTSHIYISVFYFAFDEFI